MIYIAALIAFILLQFINSNLADFVKEVRDRAVAGTVKKYDVIKASIIMCVILFVIAVEIWLIGNGLKQLMGL